MRRVPVGEADLMLTLVTRERGTVSASAGAARRPSTKLGALEPMHTLWVAIEIASGRDIGRLREARLQRPRLELLTSEARLDAASELLRAARTVLPPMSPEPVAFDAIEAGLDAMMTASSPRLALACALASLLEAIGVGISFEGCMSCGTACPPGAAAFVDPSRGGLVCQACGGGPLLLKGPQRERFVSVLSGRGASLPPEEEELLLKIVRHAAQSHGVQRPGVS